MARKPKLLIANRGEIAVRIARTCREMGIPSVAVYSDADRDALHVEMADEAHRIGPALASRSYLAIDRIVEAARRSKATLVHPGYGFLAERSAFAQAVADAGLTFVGPSPEAIERMGDKAMARRIADEAGMPIVPGTREPVDVSRAKQQARRIGFPLLVKAAFGGGGKGMHVVRDAAHLEESLRRAAREANAYFGRPEVFLERYVDRAHHVEAQIIADRHGNVVFFGERDCSVQRRHQKLIEETPSPLFDEELRGRFAEAATALARAAGYLNAGTIECILDEDGAFYFLEMNTRLQVEHTVTEMVTGFDLVRLQIEVALGGSLEGLDPQPRGHAIQCRINAEDPGRNFLPGPGRITRYREPGGPFVRVDSGVEEGREVPGDYDSMVAKLVASGADREQARRRMLRALDEYVIEGIPTTIPVHRWILETDAFRTSAHTTTWLERALADAALPAYGQPPSAATVAARALPRDVLVEVDGRRVPVRIFDERRPVAPKPPSSHAAAEGGHVHGEIRAPMQGTILKVLVEKGQPIRAGDVICILEAMKMENHIASNRDGEVTDLPIRAGQVVETDQLLAVID
ncbi:MAG: acetyl-/propionyl-CoA carboxylase subunit alpha [Actinomycetota bacterium]|jgi:acetyl-CoA/propionyl-CoA carboxylase biotin carboxyl carrier protein|nr:MAG: acetyl-/propionyl-CoA carboxylase subunit alpha [Actinomycetota bacterium]